MLTDIIIDYKSKTPIYLQIAETISAQIEKGKLQNEEMLPSINVFNETYGVARDTVERAYKQLKAKGYITSVSGRGYYVIWKKNKKNRILFVFNKLSSFKKIIYYSFLKTLGNKAIVDLQIHHYNPLLLKNILDNNLGKYDYYVIMPHFEANAKKAAYMKELRRIPANQLVILDKSIPELKGSRAVFQDFQMDIYNALLSVENLLEKYNGLTLLFPEDNNHPPEIIQGVSSFGKEKKKSFKVIPDTNKLVLKKGMVYIVISDDQLAALLKIIRKSNYQLGRDIGLISFNETELKELLDITVISSDFEQMGHTAADLILNNKVEQIKNPFKIIKRGSL